MTLSLEAPPVLNTMTLSLPPVPLVPLTPPPTHTLVVCCSGLHLAPKDLAPRIEPTIQDMAALQPALVVGGHCTGGVG